MMKKAGLVVLVTGLMLGLLSGAALAARAGGTLNFMAPYGGDLFSLDPQRSTRVQDFLVIMNIYRSLYKWDPDQSKPVLDLATEVSTTPDGLAHTYKLRKNIKFHNGRNLTVDDIIYTYNRIMNPKMASPAATHLRLIVGAKDVEAGKAESISGLKKIDDYTLAITFENPVDPAYFLFQIGTSVVPKEEIEKKGDKFAIEPVGCGAFKFVRWVKGSEVILEKFPDFYLEGRPYLDKVVYKIMTEAAARDNAFRAQELDGTIVGPAQYQQYKADPVISKNMIEVAELFTRLIGLNPNYKPLSNKLVRQAINHAIDKELIINKLLKGKAFVPVSYLPSTSPAFDPKLKGYDFNPQKAAELMKQAGYEKGFTFECIGTSNPDWGVGVVEAAMPYLKKINIEVKIQQMEGATMAERIKKGEFQAFIWSLGSSADPLVALRRWKGDNPMTAGNYVAYKNADYDKLLEEAANERNEAKRLEILRKADALFFEDAPVWFFNYNKAVLAFQPWVHGLKPVAIEMMYQDMTEVWVDEKSPRAGQK